MFNFSKREEKALIFGLAFVILFFIFQFGIVPAIEQRDTLKRILNENQLALEEMRKLQQQFLVLSNRFETQTRMAANRSKDFSLFAFLDAQAQQSGVKENIVYMKPFSKNLANSLYTLVTVKLKLKEAYLKELVAFIYHIESMGNSVTITSLSLKKARKDKEKIDAIIETQTLSQKTKV